MKTGSNQRFTRTDGCEACGQPWSDRLRPATDGRHVSPMCEACVGALQRFAEAAEMTDESFDD